jgi:hypothetical protein
MAVNEEVATSTTLNRGNELNELLNKATQGQY